jgi:hypothetical protein
MFLDQKSPEPITFDICRDSTSIEDEALIEIRAVSHYGNRIAASFHMTKDEFIKFVSDGTRFFELKHVELRDPHWDYILACLAADAGENAGQFGLDDGDLQYLHTEICANGKGE